MKRALLPLIIAVSIVIGIIAGSFFAAKGGNKLVNIYSSSKIDEVMNLIQRKYVDTIQTDSIAEAIIPQIVAQLDPHSMYISSKDLPLMQEELSGSFYGIGVEFNFQEDTIHVVSVISGGPSEKVGIKAGDKIVAINDTALLGRNLNDKQIISSLRGSNKTQLNLKIVRLGVEAPIDFTVTRGRVPNRSVYTGYMIEPSVGYILVNKFGDNTYQEFITYLTKLSKEGMKSLIIDIRGNSGGYPGATIEMLNEFLNKGDKIVYIQGAHQMRTDSHADGNGSFKNLKLAVLIDEFSGSASEILAGAIQDNDRGTIIGRRSFGKALVQQEFELGDGSALRLTIAKYYTPSGRCIQKPYTKGNLLDYEMDIINRYRHGEFYSKDSISENTKEVYKTRLGRDVYGGGGIMPDIFVPSDTTGSTKFYKDVVNNGLIYKFALRYSNFYRADMAKYKNWRDLQKYLQSQSVYNQLVNYCKRKGVTASSHEVAKTKSVVERHIFAYIIRNILGDDGFYPFVNQSDKAVVEAIKVLKSQE